MSRGGLPVFLLLAAGCFGPRGPATIIIAPPVPVPESAPPKEAQALPTPSDLAGKWTEELMGIVRCSDTTTIGLSPSGQIDVKSRACSDGSAYRTESADFDGTTLRLKLTVPETRLEFRYEFKQATKRVLVGQLFVTRPDDPSIVRGGETRQFDVKWFKR